jgi:hypothetical protein
MTDATLAEMLAKNLDDANPDHWTDEGAPRLSVAQKVTGLPKLTRAEIAATGRIRKMASAPAAEIAKPIDTADAINVAEINLQTARDRVTVARADLKIKRGALASAVTNWQAEFPKLTQRDLIKAVSNRAPGPEQPPPNYQSPLDAVLASGRGGNCNVDFRRKARQLIQSK